MHDYCKKNLFFSITSNFVKCCEECLHTNGRLSDKNREFGCVIFSKYQDSVGKWRSLAITLLKLVDL